MGPRFCFRYIPCHIAGTSSTSVPATCASENWWKLFDWGFGVVLAWVLLIISGMLWMLVTPGLVKEFQGFRQVTSGLGKGRGD